MADASPILQISELPLIGTASLVMGKMPETGTPILAIDAPSLYQREGGPYADYHGNDWHDNALRFGILSLIAAKLSAADSPLSDWIPDIVHCNDWQTGLTPAYLQFSGQPHAKSVMSIHNMAFQGCFPPEWVYRLGLPSESFQMHGLEYYGHMSFLKAGLYYADSITTVSPTYAKEIQTDAFGFGMQGLMADRAADIRGILNGIETQEWNPEADPYLATRYDASHLEAKLQIKQALQHKFFLSEHIEAPLLGVVSRLTFQKGLDMLLEVAQPLLDQGCQMVILGSGEPALENGFRALAYANPDQVSTTIGYNEPLSHQIMAGVDMFIMPSRFEPCGLNQMYGMRYGTPPIVTNTGGLADSVVDTNEGSLKSKRATGFVMPDKTPEGLLSTIERALGYYRTPKQWKRIQQNGMRRDLSWKESALQYLETYTSLLQK